MVRARKRSKLLTLADAHSRGGLHGVNTIRGATEGTCTTVHPIFTMSLTTGATMGFLCHFLQLAANKTQQ
jgi:hypothetical protein